MDRGVWQATVHGSQKVRHNWAIKQTVSHFSWHGHTLYGCIKNSDTPSPPQHTDTHIHTPNTHCFIARLWFCIHILVGRCCHGWNNIAYGSSEGKGKYNCCCCSVTKPCPTLCSSMDCSTPGLPVPHSLPGFAQTHVHWVGDAIQPSHPLLPSSLFAFNLSQHQGLFQWVSCSESILETAKCSLVFHPFVTESQVLVGGRIVQLEATLLSVRYAMWLDTVWRDVGRRDDMYNFCITPLALYFLFLVSCE